MKAVFDIGGSHLRVALSRDGKNFSTIVSHDTPRTKEEGFELLRSTMMELANGEPVASLTGGVAGIVRDNTLIHSVNLPGWEGADFSEVLPETRSRIVNDAVGGCLGEAWVGAGKGHRIVAYLTAGTGIGGARVVHGVPDEVKDGFEPGWQIIQLDGKETLGDFVSGRAIKERYDGRKVRDLSQRELREVAEIFAVGIHNTLVHWSPDVLVLGGLVILDTPPLVPLIRVSLESILTVFPVPPIAPAALGDHSVLYGALALSKTNHE